MRDELRVIPLRGIPELEEGDDPKAMFQELRDLVNDQVRAVR